MIDSVIEWLGRDAHLAMALSVCFVTAGLVLYLVLGRRLARYSGVEKAEGRQRLLLGLGILLLVVVALALVWRGHFEFLQRIDNWLRKNEVYGNLLWTVVAGVVVYLVARTAEHALIEGADDIETRHKIRRAVHWGRTVVFIVSVILIWQSKIRNVGVFLGIIGAGVALSLQEALLCIVGWTLIVAKRPFDIGDRIEIDTKVGDVIDISVFQTSLLEVGNWVAADQTTGRIINIPNSMLFRAVNCNYTKGFPFIWNELVTVVTFESDWERAKEIILKQAQEEAEKIEAEVSRQVQAMHGRYAIRYQRLRPFVYTHIVEHGVALTLRYLTPVRKRRDTTHEISEGILEDFKKEPNIDFAYPTTRFYDSATEGKLAAARRRAKSPRQGTGEAK